MGLPSNLVWNIIRARSDGALWVGTAQGIVRFPKQGEPQGLELGSATQWDRPVAARSA